MRVAIIPARGGSKRIPRKNIRAFLGKPIIDYSIAAAKNAQIFDAIMVSTDDEEIADIARKSGASVPFMRSAETADDHATTAAVLLEVLGSYASLGQDFDTVCCIYATAPFVTSELLLRGHEILRKPGVDSVLPVVRFGFPPQRALLMHGDQVRFADPTTESMRSQDLPAMFHDTGQFYWIKADVLKRHNKLFTLATSALEVPETEVQDIDSETDWQLAELKFKLRAGQSP